MIHVTKFKITMNAELKTSRKGRRSTNKIGNGGRDEKYKENQIKILEMENEGTEMKNAFSGLGEEMISKLENKLVENNPSEAEI